MHTEFGRGNLKGRNHLESRCRWENIKTDFKEVRWEGVDWIHLAQERVL
jgi:hypothetical protein